MRVLIVHNPVAGKAARRGIAIVRAFKDAGHQVWYRSTSHRTWVRALDDAIDLVIVVGGDGTVAEVVRELAPRTSRQAKPPVSILPFGTANNVARSLGMVANAERLAANLERSIPTPFRVLRVSAAWGERLAVESAGIGVFPRLFREAVERERRAKREGRPLPNSWSVGQARKKLMDVVRTAKPQRVHVRADGQDLSGEYLLVEALNIGRIGPRARLSRTADVGDLRMDLLLVGGDRRNALLEYLASSDADDFESSLQPLRVREARIEWPATDGHVDDALWPKRRWNGGDGRRPRVRVRVDHALTMWLPPTAT